MPSATTPDRRGRASACPICGKPEADATRPFCSQGCRDRDLLQWLSDGRSIPGPNVDEDDQTLSDGLDS